MVPPSNPEYVVKGAFNPGAVTFNDEIILLLRVAESCFEEKGYISVPIITFNEEHAVPDVLKVKADDPGLVLKDTRGVVYKGTDYLSTMSHIRIARSKDGHTFSVDEAPFIFSEVEDERFGVEDARITKIDDVYYINYTCVSPDGWVTKLSRTTDFVSVEDMGIIFHPQNKDVSIFPEMINGKYCALHRPNNAGFGKPSIWYAESPDLLHWGNHRCLIRPRDMDFEGKKIGGGAPCLKTEQGWLQMYHGKSSTDSYSLFVLLLDLNDPSKVLARGTRPVLQPEERYETDGFYGNVIFSNGLIERANELLIYYGACDETTCVARTTIDELLASLSS
jgi:predicted GH43/DUF377 family glycosyl hydrolase